MLTLSRDSMSASVAVSPDAELTIVQPIFDRIAGFLAAATRNITVIQLQLGKDVLWGAESRTLVAALTEADQQEFGCQPGSTSS